ncbi:DUF4974 domain-containing protein [Pseudoflavitalea sp. G-6-1-2]|uniref:FecR family protein n=1 Tax=Pseudoflavitalea sp. G-6-1-2 TaxID=2728841 RepID=UPI00146EF325|nr:FecR family protein [Pseudoflavitalea sp. G-6-1-2]NML22313.1 DUF4974 domain-containing protein [Pseudoflavitalea sp. G-6-1-2]
MQQQRTRYLLERYISGKLSEDEWNELQQLSETSQLQVQETIQQWLESREADTAYDAVNWQPVIDRITTADKQQGQATAKVVPLFKRAWFRYAAAAVVLATGIVLFWPSSKSDKTQIVQESKPVKRDVPPGKNGAILTLADGTQLVLDSMNNGQVVIQNGTHVVLNDGELNYYTADRNDGQMVYNTMTTPRGRQYNVTLPDGTKVFLNAESTIRFPTAFAGNERRVEVTGEAYFDVAKNAEKPFKVSINNEMEVVVMGTRFNVNAYADEPMISATLIDGSVRVVHTSPRGVAYILNPGQQASLKTADAQSSLQVKEVDLSEVTAWKDGAFVFNDADLRAVMRQLARWYNVEVVYEGNVPHGEYRGKIGRSLSLVDVMEGISEKKLNYRIEGNKITILP